jgi:hypothetical protein
MKTAMQELISQMHNLTWKLMTYEQKIEVFNVFLEKEKEQIKDAWDAGMSEGIGTMMADLDWDGEFINYYNETYNNETIN